jgi:hypothetical protein
MAKAGFSFESQKRGANFTPSRFFFDLVGRSISDRERRGIILLGEAGWTAVMRGRSGSVTCRWWVKMESHRLIFPHALTAALTALPLITLFFQISRLVFLEVTCRLYCTT